jgi:hypothetical protein
VRGGKAVSREAQITRRGLRHWELAGALTGLASRAMSRAATVQGVHI